MIEKVYFKCVMYWISIAVGDGFGGECLFLTVTRMKVHLLACIALVMHL